MSNYVETEEVGPLSYCIEKSGREYRLWLNGCRIGRPRPDKPPDETWEYHATTLDAAREEISKDAQERLSARIREAEMKLNQLRKALVSLEKK